MFQLPSGQRLFFSFFFSFERLVGSSFNQESLSFSHRFPSPRVLIPSRTHESSPSTDHVAPSPTPFCDGAFDSVSPTSLAVPLPDLESLFRPTLPILHHIPKGARNAWASLVSNLCSDISRDPSCLSIWTKFFMLPRCVLGNPVRGGQSNWRNTLSMIRPRIRRWKADEVCELWNEMLAENAKCTHKSCSRKVSAESALKSKIRRAIKVCH